MRYLTSHGMIALLTMMGMMMIWPPSPLVAQAPGGLTGRVVDPSHVPLADARVRLRGLDQHTLTDQAGRFRFAALPAGEYEVEVRHAWHTSQTQRLRVAPGRITEAEFVLRPSPVELQPVVVTAVPGRDQRSRMQSATDLSGRALERNAGTTIGETLSGVPGISLRYNGPAAGIPVIRGLTGERVSLLQDGQRTGDLAGSADDHSMMVDPLDAHRIEVVRGPSSLLYGSNAIAGVVNVITEDIPFGSGEPVSSAMIVQSQSAAPGVSASGRVRSALGERWAVSARSTFRSAGDVRLGSRADPDRLPGSYQQVMGGSFGLAREAGNHRAGIALQLQRVEHGVPMPPDEEGVVLEGERLSARGEYAHALAAPGLDSLRVRGSLVRYGHDELVDGDRSMAFGLDSFEGDIRIRQAPRGRHRDGVWGLSVISRDYSATGEEQLVAPTRALAAGLFGYQEFEIPGPNAVFQAGGRVDWSRIASRDDTRFGPGIERTYTKSSGSAGLSAEFLPGLRGSLSVAGAFRVPSVEELFSNAFHAGTASYERGDPDLEPERAVGLEGILRFDHPGVRSELSLYTQQIRGFIHFTERGDTLIGGTRWPILVHDQSDARLSGFEAQIAWSPVEGVLLGALADAVVGRLGATPSEPIPFLPAARVTGSARWERSNHEVGVELRQVFHRSAGSIDADIATPSYMLLDLHAGTTMVTAGGNRHSLQLRAGNLTNRLYRDAASRIKEFAANPGRNLSLTYRLHF